MAQVAGWACLAWLQLQEDRTQTQSRKWKSRKVGSSDPPQAPKGHGTRGREKESRCSGDPSKPPLIKDLGNLWEKRGTYWGARKGPPGKACQEHSEDNTGLGGGGSDPRRTP